MSAGHTPAPWVWDGGWLNGPSGDSILYYTTDDDGIHGKREDKDLVAAAPELLEALEKAITWDSYDSEGVPAVWLDNALKAIEKAKGGANG